VICESWRTRIGGASHFTLAGRAIPSRVSYTFRASCRCGHGSAAGCRFQTIRARSQARWRDLPASFGPYTTCYNRFVRWRRAGVWSRIMDALAAPHDAAVQMIDTSIVRVHQHAACIACNKRQSMGRSRGGLTSKIHAVVDRSGLPVRLALTTGSARQPACRETLVPFEVGINAAGRPRL